MAGWEAGGRGPGFVHLFLTTLSKSPSVCALEAASSWLKFLYLFLLSQVKFFDQRLVD